MSEPTPPTSLFVVQAPTDASVIDAVAQAMSSPATPYLQLPALTNVALGDPYLAQQLADLHATWELRPPPSRSLFARLRTRLAWWLLGPELHETSAVHATLVRLIDSLIVQLDQERAARRRIEEHLSDERLSAERRA